MSSFLGPRFASVPRQQACMLPGAGQSRTGLPGLRRHQSCFRTVSRRLLKEGSCYDAFYFETPTQFQYSSLSGLGTLHNSGSFSFLVFVSHRSGITALSLPGRTILSFETGVSVACQPGTVSKPLVPILSS